jgi:hypothetical protein
MAHWMMVRRHQGAEPYVGEGGAYVFAGALRTAEEDFVVTAELDVAVEAIEADEARVVQGLELSFQDMTSIVSSVDEDT